MPAAITLEAKRQGLAMICDHLKKLFDVCEQHQIRLGSSDMIRIVCTQCNREETCPSALLTEIEQRQVPTAPPVVEPKTSRVIPGE